jgi:DNA-nicking Smr family endonuclease
MKKRQAIPQKQKEFAITPFTALKGLQGVTAKPPAAKADPAKVVPKTESSDLELFFQAMSGVEQLGEKKLKAPADKPVVSVKAVVRKIEESEQQLFIEVINGMKLDVRFADDPPDPPAPAKPPGSSRLKQLRRGTIRLDYELDLHGLGKDEALDALTMFIGGAFRRQQQAVLVITGRGNHSPAEPVLKSAVESWLREPGKEMVAEFLQAPRQMGGDGAIVVFLKKSPESK